MGLCGTWWRRLWTKSCLTSRTAWQLWMPGLGDRRFAAGFSFAVDHADERPQSARHAGVRGRRDDQRRLLRGALQARDLLLELFEAERVRLAERDDLGLVGEAVAVGFEFVAHGLVVLAGMFASAVDEMQQHTAALDMAEEAVAEPDAFMRIFDQSGEIREHELARVDAHDA